MLPFQGPDSTVRKNHLHIPYYGMQSSDLYATYSSIAAPPGLEPRMLVPKTKVLPLHYGAMVLVMGLEPILPFGNYPLKIARLPIPPHEYTLYSCYARINYIVTCQPTKYGVAFLTV